MAWVIEGDARAVPSQGYDGSVWEWHLTSSEEPGQQHFVLVRISGTMMAMGKDALGSRAAMARDSQGRSEIEAIVAWPEPPGEIELHSQGVRRSGGDPGLEQREINEITRWFEGRGAAVFLLARGVGSGDADTVQMTHHTAYVAAKGADTNLFRTEGSSPLEAIRRAKEKWESDGHGVYLQLQPAKGKASTSMTLTTPQSDRAKKAQEASRTSGREFFVVAWQPLPSAENGAKSAHFVEVMNQDGEVIEAGMGDDLEDSILEIAPSLLPDWRTPPETS